MNYLRFVRTNVQPTADKIAAATFVDDFAKEVEANKSIEKYVFEESDNLNTYAKADGNRVELLVRDLPNGSKQNRIKLTTANGEHDLRVYGLGRGVLNTNARVLTADEMKNLEFGYCTSGGKYVTEDKYDPSTGVVSKVRVWYCNIRNLS